MSDEMKESVEYIEEGSVFHGSAVGVMGTRLDLVICGGDLLQSQKLWNGLLRDVERLDRVFNRFDPASEVSTLNKAVSLQGVGVSDVLYQALLLSMEYNENTSGLFDVARGHMRDIEISETGTVSLYGYQLDFGGFAKGFFARRAERSIRAAGFDSAYLDFGGSTIVGIGTHPYGDSWKVTLTDPYGGKSLGEVSLRDQALSTSGNTPSYSGHIINPLTGESDTDRKLATVVAGDALDAEVLSTAAMIADEKQISELAECFPGVEIKTYNLETEQQ